MLKHPTLDQLHALGLHGMAKAFAEIMAGGEADGLGHHEWLGLLLDRETSWRQNKRFAARLRVAKLRQQACIEDVDYRYPRGLDRALFQKLIEGEWITVHDNLALLGPRTLHLNARGPSFPPDAWDIRGVRDQLAEGEAARGYRQG